MTKKSLTRREFIRVVGFAIGGTLLAACATPQPQTVEVVQTQVVEKVVKETVQVEVEKVVTVTPMPAAPPEPVVLDVWWNTDIPDIKREEWKPDPENEEFKKKWNWGGLACRMYRPFLEKHPGVTMKISSHSWDWDLRQNQLMALAAGIFPDTTYGEAYVNEFVQLGVFASRSRMPAQSSSPKAPYAGRTNNGKVYGLPKSSGRRCAVHQPGVVGQGWAGSQQAAHDMGRACDGGASHLEGQQERQVGQHLLLHLWPRRRQLWPGHAHPALVQPEWRAVGQRCRCRRRPTATNRWRPGCSTTT